MAFRLPGIKIPIQGVDEFTKVMNAASKRINRMGQSVKRAGRSMTVGLTLPIVGLGAATLKMSNDFNKSMANVGTLIPGNIERLRELKAGVQSLAIDTGKATGDIAGGLFELVSAFGDSAESAEKLRLNTRGAVAGVATVQETLALTSAVTKAFGDTTAVATRKVLDLSFKTNELGQTTFAQLAANLPRVTGFSKDLGVSMEEMFAVMATGTGVTGGTAEVATQLAGILGALSKPSADLTIALSKLGFTGKFAGKELIAEKGLFGALRALDKITTEYDIPLGKLLGRKEALILTSSLLGAQSEDLARKFGLLQNVSGSMEKAYKEQSEGINAAGFSMAQFLQRVVVLGQKLGDQLAPKLNEVLNRIIPLLDWIADLSPATMTWVFGIAAAAAALGPLVFMLGQMIIMIALLTKVLGTKFLVGALTKVGFALKALVLSPLGLIIAATLIWANVIRLVVKHWDNLKDLLTDFNLLMKTLGILFEPVKAFFGFGGPPEGAEGAGVDATVGAAVAAAGGASSQKTEVDVNFLNAPPGTRTEIVGGGGNVNLMTQLGLLGAGGP